MTENRKNSKHRKSRPRANHDSYDREGILTRFKILNAMLQSAQTGPIVQSILSNPPVGFRCFSTTTAAVGIVGNLAAFFLLLHRRRRYHFLLYVFAILVGNVVYLLLQFSPTVGLPSPFRSDVACQLTVALVAITQHFPLLFIAAINVEVYVRVFSVQLSNRRRGSRCQLARRSVL